MTDASSFDLGKSPFNFIYKLSVTWLTSNLVRKKTLPRLLNQIIIYTTIIETELI